MPAAGKDAKRFQQAASSLINDPKLVDTFKQLDENLKSANRRSLTPKVFLAGVRL